MFIYKITANGKSYIGLDTYPTHLMKRWKTHLYNSKKGRTKLYNEMRKAGVENCTYEVLEEGFENIVDLAKAEIRYIQEYDTYENGLNGTLGGDGWGSSDLQSLTDTEVSAIKEQLSITLSEYNHKVKWANLSEDEKKEMCKHLHCDEVYQKKADTLKKTYESNPDLAKAKAELMKSYWDNLTEEEKIQRKEVNKRNSLLGAKKVSKQVRVQFANGEVKLYNSKSDYAREHGHDLKYVLQKTQKGKLHNGKKAWEN